MARNLSVLEPSVERWRPHLTLNIFSALLTLIIVIGNSTLLLFILKSRFKLMKSNLFILSLTVSDFLIGLLVTPFAHYVSLYDVSQLFCDAYLNLGQFLARNSSITIMIISIDRYMKLSHPIKYKTIWCSTRRRIGLIALTWSFSFGLTIIKFTDSILNSGNYTKGCFYRESYSTIEQVELVVTLVGTNIVALIIYVKILLLVRNPRQPRLQNLSRGGAKNGESIKSAVSTKSAEKSAISIKSVVGVKSSFSIKSAANEKSAENQASAEQSAVSGYSAVPTKIAVFDPKMDSSQGYQIPTFQNMMVVPSPASNDLRRHLGHYSPIFKSTKVKCHARRPSIVLGLIVVSNLIFVAVPPFVFSLFIICEACANETVMQIIPWIFWMSCAVNPIIFALLNNDFRSFILSFCAVKN